MAKLTRLNGSENWSHTCELRVEIAGVSCALDLRHERRSHSLVVNVLPVDIPEEWLAHDLLGVGGTATQSLVGLPCQELLQN